MLILRKDISEKVKNTELFIINARVLSDSSSDSSHLKIWKNKSKSLIHLLNEMGVRVVGFKSSGKSIRKGDLLGMELIELNGNRKIDILSYCEGNYSFRDMVVMGNEVEDMDLIRHCRFSTTTINAPLELKMEAQYISNFSGTKAFGEVGNLIIHAKRNNGQN